MPINLIHDLNMDIIDIHTISPQIGYYGFWKDSIMEIKEFLPEDGSENK